MLEKQDRVLGGGEAWNIRREVGGSVQGPAVKARGLGAGEDVL